MPRMCPHPVSYVIYVCMIQVVDEVYDEDAAAAMQLKKGTVCIMIHTGSRGLGHQVSPALTLTM